MSQLTFPFVPAFNLVPDTSLAGDQPLTSDVITNVNHNAMFGVVRCERIFMGFFKNGDIVPTPVSPVDGYAYTRAETTYEHFWALSRAPGAGFVSGQTAFPPQANSNGSAGQIFFFEKDIDDSTGLVQTTVNYATAGGPGVVTNDGCLKVYAVGQRQSVNVAN